MAKPGDRFIHPRPTARLGGFAIYLGFGLAIAILFDDHHRCVLLSAAGSPSMAFDDIVDLNWLSKLGIQWLPSSRVLGIAIISIAIPGSHTLAVWELGLLAAPVTVVWFVGLQITINLLDGVDGLAAGVVAIVAASAARRHQPHPGGQRRPERRGDPQRGGDGRCLGFLVFNLPPARVFMGESGSHFLGIALGTITILGVAKVVVGLSILVPLIALGLPIGDTLFAIVRRALSGPTRRRRTRVISITAFERWG